MKEAVNVKSFDNFILQTGKEKSQAKVSAFQDQSNTSGGNPHPFPARHFNNIKVNILDWIMVLCNNLNVGIHTTCINPPATRPNQEMQKHLLQSHLTLCLFIFFQRRLGNTDLIKFETEIFFISFIK